MLPGAPPLYGTATIFVPVMYMKSSAAMCVLVAMPLVATLSCPGLALASAVSSFTDLAGTAG